MREIRPNLRALHPATWVLLALIAAGVVLRVLAAIATWPVSNTLADAGAYASYAATNPLADYGHPAGYPGLLAIIGVVSREVAVVTVLQHLVAIGTALLFYAGVRRLTGSRWAGLLPAAAVLLNADLMFLEDNVLSEPSFIAMLALTLYATIRAFDAPDPWRRWPAITGLLLGLLTVVRSTGIFLIPVAVLVLILAQPRWRWHALRPAAVTTAVAVIVLVLYSSANLISNGRFEVGPAQGWHLYARVAPFADCRVFTPPKGTSGLCESTPVPQRPSSSYYLYDPASPLARTYGPAPWKKHDSDLRAFAIQVITHQPRAYVTAMWRDVKTYYVPSLWPGDHLDGELDWKARTKLVGSPLLAGYEPALERFFNDYHAHASIGVASFLRGYQRVFRFGATMLSIASLLTLLGLFVGSRRNRIGVLLFGVGGLALLIAPVVSVFYVARYMVPLAAPLFAAAAITLLSLYRLQRSAGSRGGVEDSRAEEEERGARDHEHGADVRGLLGRA